MNIRFIGIIKIDPNQAPGTAFLSCLQDKAEKFVVLIVEAVAQTVCLHLG